MSQLEETKPAKITSVAGFVAYPHRAPNSRRKTWSWRLVQKLETGRTTTYANGTAQEIRQHLYTLADTAGAASGAARTFKIVTIGDLARLWLGHMRDRRDGLTLERRLAKRSFKQYTLSMAMLLNKYGQRNVLITDLTNLHIKELTRRLLLEGETAKNVQRRLQRLVQAWKWARSENLVPDRDLTTPVRSRAPNKPRATPSEAVLLQLLDRLRHYLPCPWAYHAAYVMAYTGLRVGEAADMRWVNVDLERKIIGVQGTEGNKTGAREVHFDDSVGRILRQCLGMWSGMRGDHVFPTQLESMTHQLGTGGALGKALRGIGLRDDELFTSHGLRRFSVQRLRRAGAGVKANAQHHGHTVEVMIKVYDAATPEERISAIEAAYQNSLEVREAHEARSTTLSLVG